jgi:uncharacterized cupin superfamily protein
MSMISFETAHTAVDLKPAPIAPDWIVAGAPRARAAELSRSPDGSASTVVWECTGGSFNWTYHCDETIHILEGSIVLTDSERPPTRLGPGDIVFFPKGSRVHWQVEGYVKKIAFLRSTLPTPLGAAYKLLRRLRNIARGASVPTRQFGLAD